MAASRAVKASRKTTGAAKAVPADRPRQSPPAGVSRMVSDMLRDLQIDGKALSTQIERLRQRFA